MTDKVSRIAIICALEETIRDEVKRMCDTDILAELDTMALHAKENIENLRSVKYKTLVKESAEVVKSLVKDTPQTDCEACRYNSDEWDSPKCDSCSKAHSNYEPHAIAEDINRRVEMVKKEWGARHIEDEPQIEKCPFDDPIPCEWVCTEYSKCKYKPKDEPQTERSEE